MSPPVTEEQLKAALPGKLKTTISKTLIKQVNTRLNNPESWEVYKENLLSYGHVMKDGKFKIEQYIHAVKYVSFKLLGLTNKDAYKNTFPDKYQNFLLTGVSSKDIASYTSAYNKTKLVNLIYEQTLIPTHVLNAPMFQQALNTQASLMINARSEKVRSDAANSILTHLKRPEAQKVELDIGLNKDKTLDTLRATTLALMNMQKQAIQNNLLNADDVAKQKLIPFKDNPDAP